MDRKKVMASVAFLLLSLGVVHAQEASSATGGNAIGAGGTASYTVGQVVYTSNTGTNGIVAQGVQQAFEIFTLGVKEVVKNISLTAFPNPTTENLTLQIRDYNSEKLSFQLFSIEGKQLSSGQITAEQTQINMKSLQSATYFINVVNQENRVVQSFKIIKN